MTPLRAIFLGQKPIGEKCFDYLITHCQDFIEVCATVSNSSDKVWWKSASIHTKSRQHNIPFVSNEKRNSKLINELIRSTAPNILISVQHPWILPAETLQAVNYNAFNLHNAKLPDYKGNNTCNHAILNKESSYTCTLHWLADEVDMGDIAYEESFQVLGTDTAKSLYERSYVAGQKLFYRLMNDLKNNITPSRKKIEGEGCFYPRNSIDQLKEISSLKNILELELKSKAFYFPVFEKAYSVINGRKYYVLPDYTGIDTLQLTDII